jgi:predicted DNA-binding protein (MmcQ/YjbR family)
MNIELLRNHCISKKGVKETFPFGEDTLVFKVMEKAFALISLSSPDNVNLKCDPELAVDLRERYACVRPGYHMNKKHWNTVDFDGSVSDEMIFEWIDHSYDMVVRGMSKKEQAALAAGKAKK